MAAGEVGRGERGGDGFEYRSALDTARMGSGRGICDCNLVRGDVGGVVWSFGSRLDMALVTWL